MVGSRWSCCECSRKRSCQNGQLGGVWRPGRFCMHSDSESASVVPCAEAASHRVCHVGTRRRVAADGEMERSKIAQPLSGDGHLLSRVGMELYDAAGLLLAVRA